MDVSVPGMTEATHFNDKVEPVREHIVEATANKASGAPLDLVDFISGQAPIAQAQRSALLMQALHHLDGSKHKIIQSVLKDERREPAVEFYHHLVSTGDSDHSIHLEISCEGKKRGDIMTTRFGQDHLSALMPHLKTRLITNRGKTIGVLSQETFHPPDLLSYTVILNSHENPADLYALGEKLLKPGFSGENIMHPCEDDQQRKVWRTHTVV